MRGHELLDKMELIDPAYVEAAEMAVQKKKTNWFKWGAMAACIGIAALSVWGVGKRQETSQFADLEPITISELNSAQGFEGYLCYDISELENGNPWSEQMELTVLPVYENKAYDTSGAGVPKGLSEEELKERLERTLDELDLEVISTKLVTTEIQAETNNGSVKIEADGTVTYFPIEEKVALPELVEKYAAFLQFEEPELVSYGDYTFEGEFYPEYKVFEASGNQKEDVLNYNFNSVQIALFENGETHLIRKKEGLLLADKVGDYPIISVKEATKLLVAGKYQTSVPYEFQGKKHIGKVELVYRIGSSEEYLLPYYRFYVELTEEKIDNGLKTYGAYYVPAVVTEYIKNMPAYEIDFTP